MKISIIGTGYVGLVTGACLAEKGHDIVCVDINPDRVESLNRAESPIFETGLEELLKKHVGKRLKATTDTTSAVHDSDVTMIAVGTPFNGDSIDLTAVLNVARDIGTALKKKDGYHLVVVKSTVVPTTTDQNVLPVLEEASEKRAGIDFGVGMNPEFLSEGEAVNDFLYPDRIVLGGIDDKSIEVLAKVYAPYIDVPVLRTNTRTAEMIKYASNSLLATLISFSNELANLGAILGDIDTVEVMKGVHLSQYFRGKTENAMPSITSFLNAGCGFGGSCLPKDVNALIAQGKSVQMAMPLLDAVIKVNNDQPRKTVNLLNKYWRSLNGIKISVLGLSFKPETSDVRESPAFPIMTLLLEEGAIVTAFDPVAMIEARHTFRESTIRYAETLNDAINDADAIIVVTPWKEFRQIPDLLGSRASEVVFVDSRRAFAKESFAKYEGIGL